MSNAHRLMPAAAALSLVALVAVTTNLIGSGHGGQAGPVAGGVQSKAAPAGSTHKPPTTMRRLMVSADRAPAPSQPGATMRALRLGGVVPRTAAVGTVVSDDDCAPDAVGISHCINGIRLANGRMLSVRHPHRMAEVPCMTPGERVQVSAV
jgi:hypothetical protein